MKKPLIIIGGATNSGKTKLAINLASEINGQIISADSMQVYKYMNIGTAKPRLDQMQGIRHYMIDEIYPNQKFSVADFQKLASKYLEEIYNNKKIPILVGGTGFYINSVIYDNDFSQFQPNYNMREKYYNLAKIKGNDFIYSILQKIDKESANNIHPNNLKKVVHAIEFYKQTKSKISDHNKFESSRNPKYKNLFFVLDIDRKTLYENINKRVDDMILEGFVDEVKFLLNKKYYQTLSSMNSIGYKEIIQYINDDEKNLEYFVELIKKNTRNFAKRQVTWFKNKTYGKFVNPHNYLQILEECKSFIE